ncbi:MAG: hypothetical protein ACTSYZ_08225 [Candidatus Helarchaeota archaeon]
MPGGDGTGPDGKGGCGVPNGYLRFGRGGRFRNTVPTTNSQNFYNQQGFNNVRGGGRGRGRGGGRGGWRRNNQRYPGNGPWSHLPPNKRPGWTGVIPDE